MADLPELNEWTEGIYQLETSDPVLGGPDGIDNLQGKQLANRTRWLKGKIDSLIEGTLSVAKSVKLATARTISISGAATGNASFDGSANADITMTLADSGVAAGSYAKVSVNAKGLVTGGGALAIADIPVATSAQMATGTSLSLVPTVLAVMSLFAKRSFGKNDYIRIPDVPGGLIINWGSALVNASGDINVNYPLGYSAMEFITLAVSGQNTDAAYLSTGVVLGGFTMPFYKTTTGVKSAGGFNAQWISIGR
ncbi:hypothetical protein [Pseudomonas sp. NPDC096950]|uniref:gp53-like domain-containing protein n=1 Tax=Pseudomonas sp. NPDC096950 TaxID=3364485 RepID=UPI003839E78E